MNKDLRKERLLELLADEVLFGLDKQEKVELNELQNEFPDFKNENSFDTTTTAIGLSNIDLKSEMPHNLQVKVLADADKFFDSAQTVLEKKEDSSVVSAVTSKVREPITQTAQAVETKTPFWQWLTPVFAGIACIALIGNIWINYTKKQEVVDSKNPKTIIKTPKELTNSEKRQQLLASAKDVIKTNWTSPPKDENLKGEVVWSDEKQEGYMTFKGLAKNDIDKETYQLWIFRDEKLEAHPIDGGIFDVTEDGEIIVPIDAKLNVKKPKVFAITVEKPGGVVVSERGKIPALAKVTT